MNRFIIFLILIAPGRLYSQDKVAFDAPAAFFVYYNSDFSEASRIPFGKEVEIYYDVFFKSYNLHYTDKDGKWTQALFNYVGESKENRCTFAVDQNDNKWYVYDNLQKDGELKIFNENKAAGRSWCILVEKAVKRSKKTN